MPEVVKQKIGKFYNEVGWQTEADGQYQNADYEDLRPVSAEYIARAHARVGRHLARNGQYLLDAGSGPVQYAAYLEYSRGYEKRVCFDLSIVAMQEARKKLGDHGLYVVGDIANLPFKPEAFDGIVSLHTIHHLPMEEKAGCYLGLYRCLKPGRTMVTVDGWSEHGLRKFWNFLMRAACRLRGYRQKPAADKTTTPQAQNTGGGEQKQAPAGTYVMKNSARWFNEAVGSKLPSEILTWRSVSVPFMRAVIPPNGWGRFLLKVLFRLEEWFPRYFGKNGQYPLIVISKPAQT